METDELNGDSSQNQELPSENAVWVKIQFNDFEKQMMYWENLQRSTSHRTQWQFASWSNLVLTPALAPPSNFPLSLSGFSHAPLGRIYLGQSWERECLYLCNREEKIKEKNQKPTFQENSLSALWTILWTFVPSQLNFAFDFSVNGKLLKWGSFAHNPLDKFYSSTIHLWCLAQLSNIFRTLPSPLEGNP